MKTFLLSIVVAVLAWPVAARAQSPWGPLDRGLVFDLSEYAVVTGHALDLASTQRCLGSGRCHEANPWLARYSNPLTFTAAKFAVAGVGLWVVRKVQPRHPRLAAVANYAVGAGFSALAIRNQRIGK